MHAIASVCATLGVDGHRADLVIARAAVALAALRGEATATLKHVSEVAPFALVHRVRSTPFTDDRFDVARVQSLFARPCLVTPADPSGEPSLRGVCDERGAPVSAHRQADLLLLTGDAGPHLPGTVLPFTHEQSRATLSGRTHDATSTDRTGKYVRSTPLRPGDDADIALDATIRAAAPFQRLREDGAVIRVEPQDLQRKVRTRRVGSSIVFCVDASGSMGAARRMEAAKAAVLELLVDAYQRRDRVALVSFRADGAEVILSPTSSVELAHVRLRALPTGGATPLAHGLLRSLELLEAERRRDADVLPWLVLVTDGRANVGLGTGLGVDDARSAARRVGAAGIRTLVIDTAGAGGGAPARDIARAAGAEYLRLGDIDGQSLSSAVRTRVRQ
ncbi:MAG TPA: VWA domain-containing protein [Coriobacteriia bacterium]|nr:VWA domain-containing protein [Coriobacteriia bacterium]